MSPGKRAVRYGLLVLMLIVDVGLIAFGIVYLVPHARVFGWLWLALIVGIGLVNLSTWLRNPTYPFGALRQMRERREQSRERR